VRSDSIFSGISIVFALCLLLLSLTLSPFRR
jgi:hypothetical protein